MDPDARRTLKVYGMVLLAIFIIIVCIIVGAKA
jgi:hypothetical protein